MKTFLTLGLALQGALAFPAVFENAGKRAAGGGRCKVRAKCRNSAKAIGQVTNAEIDWDPKNPTPAQLISAARTNCGAQGPCIVFDSDEQYVSTKGQHKFAPPGISDIRGPCPGLNAAANHGYLPRDGVANIPEAVNGLGANFGMDADLSGFLAAYAIIFDGDLLTQTWSIGGPPVVSLPVDVLSKPQGISFSHNKYEGDASISRCDAYMNRGDAHSLSVERYKYAWDSCTGNRCTLDKWSRDFAKKSFASIRTNPFYFAPLFSTTLVSPAAYNFVINMMSNHSAEEPNGWLTREVFDTFFGVDYLGKGKFKWKPGLERIPDNWWRRPRLGPATEYTAGEGVFGDLAAEFAAYPTAFRFGGNTNGKNTYTGIDIANFTNGAFGLQDLFTKDNLQCFAFQNLQQGIPDELAGGFNDVLEATKFITPFLSAAFPVSAECKKLGKFNNNALGQYPGRNYRPKGGSATPC